LKVHTYLNVGKQTNPSQAQWPSAMYALRHVILLQRVFAPEVRPFGVDSQIQELSLVVHP
jgi:hypothetical protein